MHRFSLNIQHFYFISIFEIWDHRIPLFKLGIFHGCTLAVSLSMHAVIRRPFLGNYRYAQAWKCLELSKKKHLETLCIQQLDVPGNKISLNVHDKWKKWQRLTTTWNWEGKKSESSLDWKKHLREQKWDHWSPWQPGDGCRVRRKMGGAGRGSFRPQQRMHTGAGLAQTGLAEIDRLIGFSRSLSAGASAPGPPSKEMAAHIASHAEPQHGLKKKKKKTEDAGVWGGP